MPSSRAIGLTALVVATTPVVRHGVRAILTDAGWSVLDEAGEAEAVPHVVVWELPMGASSNDVAALRDGIGGAPILALVSAATPDLLGVLVSAGVRGAVDRDIDEVALAQAARAVAEGRTVVNAGARTDGAGSRPPALTRRESQVLVLLCSGSTNHEIAEALVISDNTVKNHVRRLYEKLQVRSRTEAVVRAARWGLVRIDGADAPPRSPAPGSQG